MYRRSISPCIELDIFSRWKRYTFNDWKASFASLSHTKFARFRRMGKNGWHLAADFDMKHPKAAMHLVNRWTSLIFYGAFTSSTSLTLSVFTSIPRLLIIKPRNLLDRATKTHFLRLSFMPYFQRISNIPRKSLSCFASCMVLTIILSTYTSMVFPRRGSKILFAKC